MWKSIKLFHSFIYSVAWNISTFHANKYDEQTIDQKYITKCLLSLSLHIYAYYVGSKYANWDFIQQKYRLVFVPSCCTGA